MKNKITKYEAEQLCKRQGFTFEFLKQMFEIMPNSKTYTFTVEKERDRVLARAIKLNKV